MNEPIISEIQIVPIKPQNGLVAFVSFVVNNQFYLGNIAIYTSPSNQIGYRLVYPSKILPNGKSINCVYPINQETGNVIQKRIIGQYVKLIENLMKGDKKSGQKQGAT